MKTTANVAPEWQVQHWFNTTGPLTLAQLRGRVVVLYAFQMLCPGCVSHSLPQAAAIHKAFAEAGVSVIGLHSVFEHHEVMSVPALAAFLHEYRIRFPVAVDRAADNSPLPLTMQAYELQGTPSLIVIDRAGRVRLHHFGRVEDLHIGALLGQLLAEAQTADERATANATAAAPEPGCDEHSCRVR